MFELKYDDGWYVCQNELAVFRFENGASDIGFAQWVVDTLNDAQQSVERTAIQPASIKDFVDTLNKYIDSGDD